MIKLKQGATRDSDDLIFWRYKESSKNGETWVSAERFKKMQSDLKETSRIWRLNNKDRTAELIRNWRKANPESVKKSANKSYHKNKAKHNADHAKWSRENKALINAYHKHKAATDPIFKIKRNLRAGFKQALNAHLNAQSESAASFKYLGCSIPDLIARLESMFKDGMTWDNYGRIGWHIDHIKPMAMFDLSKESEQRKACHYTNLQPLWALENSAKGARWIG
jgi:hypothetical protein